MPAGREGYPDWSSYNYVRGNPLSLFDPNGMHDSDQLVEESLKAAAEYWNYFLNVLTFKSGNDKPKKPESDQVDSTQSESVKSIKTLGSVTEAVKENAIEAWVECD